MNISLGKEQAVAAVDAGLELLGPKSGITVPIHLNEGVFLLRKLLEAIATGTIGLTPVVQEPPKSPPKSPRKKVSKRAARAAVRKVKRNP